MKRYFLVVFALTTSLAAVGESANNARDYYQELYKVGGLDLMTDEYVCFLDDASLPNFFTFTKSETLKNFVTALDTPKPLQKQLFAQGKPFLLVLVYSKGIPNKREIYDQENGRYTESVKREGQQQTWTIQLRVNWHTLRFSKAVFVRGQPIATAERSGKCELNPGTIVQHGGDESN